MNITVLSGRLVYDIEVKATDKGDKYLSTRIAVPRNDKNKTTDFFNFRAWGNTAEFIAKYFKKGDPITVIGELRNSAYDKKDGTRVETSFVEATKVEFVPRASRSEESGKAAEPKDAPVGDLPFEI